MRRMEGLRRGVHWEDETVERRGEERNDSG
jgi:hypothetical protein